MAATIQVVLEGALLQATERVVRRLKVNRPPGYARHPIGKDEFAVWDKVTAWPS